ncbi:MAG: diguanylate cyclase [Acidimicrobiales bacterium]
MDLGGGVGMLVDASWNPASAELDSTWIQDALLELIESEPEATVTALSCEVPPSMVKLPAGLVDDARLCPTREVPLIGLISPSHQGAVIRAWWRARSMGIASARVRMLSGDDIKVVHLFDLREPYGVVVVVGSPERHSKFEDSKNASSGVADGQRVARFGRLVKDAASVILDVDQGTEALLGWGRDELVGTRTLDYVHPDDRDSAISGWMQMLAQGGVHRPCRSRYRRRDGGWLWLEVTNDNRLADPMHGDVFTYMVDVTDEERAVRDLHARQQLLEQVTGSLPVGVFHVDLDGVVIYANTQMVEMTGIRPGGRLQEWRSSESSTHHRELHKALASAASGQEANAVIEVSAGRTAQTFYSLRARPLRDRNSDISGVTGSLADVTVDVRRLRQLEVRAATDSLTGCLNRSAVLDQVQEALDALGGSNPNNGVAVMFVDIDGMKQINDELGHPTGDAVLVEVGRRLRESLRSCDSVGRFGGDEFLVVTPGLGSNSYALLLANHVVLRISGTYNLGSAVVPVRASLGVAWTSEPGCDAEALVGMADRAMYSSKRDGLGEPVLVS